MSRYLIAVFLCLLLACEVQPREISYGEDSCDFCRMTIVDKEHSAILVTQKGRSYVFDAIECMLNYQSKNPSVVYSFQMVADYQRPGEMIDAESASYLICQEMPSPMGAYLSAFSSVEMANSMQTQKGGEIYNWDQIRKQIP